MFRSSIYALCDELLKRKGKDEFILSMSTNSNSAPNEKITLRKKKYEEDLAVSKLQISNKYALWIRSSSLH